ncbi:MAG: aminotransferase class IV [Desulfobacterales bacterium]|nr:aminotransferase class IV [Desulfobacterales bacterium]
MIIASVRRNLREALNPQIKSLNFLNNILAKIEAIQADVYEAVMLNAGGFLTEGTISNIFFVKDDILCTLPWSAASSTASRGPSSLTSPPATVSPSGRGSSPSTTSGPHRKSSSRTPPWRSCRSAGWTTGNIRSGRFLQLSCPITAGR